MHNILMYKTLATNTDIFIVADIWTITDILDDICWHFGSFKYFSRYFANTSVTGIQVTDCEPLGRVNLIKCLSEKNKNEYSM